MTHESDSLERRGIVFLVLGTVGMSLIPIMAQIVMRTVPPRHFTGIWMAFSTVWAGAFILKRGLHASIERICALRRPLLAIGVFATGWVYLYFYGVARLDAAVATFLINSRILWGVFLGVILFGEKLGVGEAIGTVATILGVFLVLFGDLGSGDLMAMLAVLISAVFYVLLTVTVKQYIPRGDVPLALLARFIGPAVLLTLLSFSLEPSLSFLTGRAILMLVVGSFFGPFLSFFLIFTAMPLVRLSVQSLFQSLPIGFTAVFSYLTFGTIPTLLQYMGGALILISVIVVGLRRQRPHTVTQEPVAETITQEQK